MGGRSGQKVRVRESLSRSATERRLIDDQLARIEQASQSVLKALNYPTTLDALAGYSWSPSKQLTLPQRKQYRRAFRTMQALLYVDQTRRFLDEGNTARAAYAAMQAGVFGGVLLSDAERGAKIQQSVRKGGRVKALQRRQTLIDRDREWVIAAAKWRERHPKWSQAEVARHVADDAHANAETVRRRLRTLLK
jgi:hypothetical protein